jgi:transketolase
MGLEDIAALRAVHSSTVLYPSDAVSAAKLVEKMADVQGIAYIRTTRGAYPVLYSSNEQFNVGGAKVLRRSDDDVVALIGAGVTLHSCLQAAEELSAAGIAARVIDCYSIKPIDVATLRVACRDTGGRLLVVEDHYPEGGIGEAVMEALALEDPPARVVHLAVRDLPTSGSSDELMKAAGIDAQSIIAAAKKLAGARQGAYA